MDPPQLCVADLLPLPLARQPSADAALKGQEIRDSSCFLLLLPPPQCHKLPDRLAARPRILTSIILLLESQKYLHPFLSVVPNSCLNLPQEHSGLIFFLTIY